MGKLVRDLVIVFFSVLLAIILSRIGLIDEVVRSFQNSFLISAFIAGILYASFFTAPIAVAIFIVLGTAGFNPFLIAFIGGFGSLIADLLILRFMKSDVAVDLKFIDQRLTKGFFSKILLRKPFRFFGFILGVFVIASPLPDELGVGLLALSKISVKNFALLSYALNTAGIFIVTLIGKAL